MIISEISLLLKPRRQHYKLGSADLYRRYSHILFIVVGLFGMALAQKPTLIAQPLLSFSTHPHDWAGNVLNLFAWLLPVLLWARVHKSLICGGPFSAYSRTFPCAESSHFAVDMALVATSMSLFLLPLALAAFTVLKSPHPAGVDDHFWLYFLLFVLLALSLAKTVVFGASRSDLLGQMLAFCGVALLPAWPGGEWLRLALLLALLLPLGKALMASTHVNRHKGGANGLEVLLDSALDTNALLSLLKTQSNLLFIQHWHAVLPRLVLAAAVQFFAWWLTTQPGKEGDARILCIVSACFAAGILSGFFQVFHAASKQIWHFAQSMPRGQLMLALSWQAIAAATAGLLNCVFALLYGITLQVLSLPFLAALYLCCLGLLALLGAGWIRRHRHGVIFKFALTIFWVVLTSNLLA